MAQESLTNALKHADAGRVTLTLDYRTDGLTLTVADDGHGAAETTTSVGHGLIGMRERTRLYDGTLITRSLNPGFEVVLTLPLEPEHARDLAQDMGGVAGDVPRSRTPGQW